MRFVIMGCGRVGSSLAVRLEQEGHDVAVIDRDRTAFRRLGPEFEGRRVVGVGFDRDTLIKAGVEGAHAFAAVSSGDNSNILAARVARETFGVANVVARIYDPGRAEIYQRLGIPTVGTVRWTTDQMLRRLLPEGASPEYTDPSGEVVMAEVAFHHGWIGSLLADIETHTGARTSHLGRAGGAFVPTVDTMLQQDDIYHVVTTPTRLAQVVRVLEGPPPTD